MVAHATSTRRTSVQNENVRGQDRKPNNFGRATTGVRATHTPNHSTSTSNVATRTACDQPQHTTAWAVDDTEGDDKTTTTTTTTTTRTTTTTTTATTTTMATRTTTTAVTHRACLSVSRPVPKMFSTASHAGGTVKQHPRSPSASSKSSGSVLYLWHTRYNPAIAHCVRRWCVVDAERATEREERE